MITKSAFSPSRNGSAKYWLAACALFMTLVACNQTPTKESTNDWSYLSLTTKGITYRDTLGISTERPPKDVVANAPVLSRDPHSISCVLTKAANRATFDFRYIASNNFPYAIQILNASGPASGIGNFKVTKADTNSSRTDTVKTTGSLQSAARSAAFLGHLNEPNLRLADSAIIIISEAAGTHIEATYKIWTTQNGAIDSVSGVISWHQAIINTK
jgi:hypothetical protein